MMKCLSKIKVEWLTLLVSVLAPIILYLFIERDIINHEKNTKILQCENSVSEFETKLIKKFERLKSLFYICVKTGNQCRLTEDEKREYITFAENYKRTYERRNCYSLNHEVFMNISRKLSSFTPRSKELSDSQILENLYKRFELSSKIKCDCI